MRLEGAQTTQQVLGLTIASMCLCRAVPHSLYDFDGAEVCLIVKDKQGVQLAARASPSVISCVAFSYLQRAVHILSGGELPSYEYTEDDTHSSAI